MQVEVDGVRGPPRKLKVGESSSSAEVVLAGFEVALAKLDVDEMTDVTLVTSEPTVVGYIERGWRIGSFRILKRLRALQTFTMSGSNPETSSASETRPCLKEAHDAGRAAERERVRLRVLDLHKHHEAELLERERRRITRGGSWDLDPQLHFQRGAMQVLDRVLEEVALANKDSGEAITSEWLGEQLTPPASRTAKGR